MPDNDVQDPVSPQLKRLQLQQQGNVRVLFRTMGPAILIAGLICTVCGMVSFFSSFGSFESPHYFWLCFIGLPLFFTGGVLSQLGFMGAVTRYVAGESAPVAADTVNYMADETKGAVETIARSAAKGVAEGIDAGGTATGFCPHCGSRTTTDFTFCPKCGKGLKPE